MSTSTSTSTNPSHSHSVQLEPSSISTPNPTSSPSATATATSTATATWNAPPPTTTTSTSNINPRRRTPSTSSRGAFLPTDDDEDHDEYLEGDELDEDDEADHDHDLSQAAADGLDEATVKSGYLWKRGEKRKNWKKRWFVLRSSKLAYYKNEKEYQLLRLLDMSEVHTVASVAMKKNENAFGIVTPKRTYYVKASSNSEMLSWIENLTNVKTQLQMRSTLTQELAAADISGLNTSTNPNVTSSKVTRSKERSPNVSESSAEGGAPPPSRQMSITIPGQGTYVSPAQPRPIPSPRGLSIPTKSGAAGSQAFSPLTSTSVSGGSGSDNGAGEFGLSYQSSAGISAHSSPTRATNELPHSSNVNNLSHSPQSANGETSDGSRRGMTFRSSSTSRNRSRGEDSSEGGGDIRPVSPSRGSSKPAGSSGGYFASSGTGLQRANTPGTAGALSSSEEEEDGDGEGEEWDEDEVADQAMPLPASIHGAAPTHPSQVQPQSHQSQQQPPSSNILSPNAQVRTVVQPPSQLKDPSKIIMQGYLMKQSSRRKHWRKRWFVLNGKDLTYSRSHMDSKNNRKIPLASILDAIEYTSKKGNGSGPQTSPLSPSLASPTGGHQTFNFGSVHQEEPANVERSTNAIVNERENVENSLRDEAKSESTATLQQQQQQQPHPSPQPPKPERRTSLVAAAANIGERLGGVTSSNPKSDQNPNLSTSPNLGGSSSLPSSHHLHHSTPKKKKENCFKIITPKRTFVVCAPTEEEEIKWLGAIQALLTRSRGSTTTTITSNPPFNQTTTTGFTLDLPNSNTANAAQNQQPTESNNTATINHQSPSQVAPAAPAGEGSGSLSIP